MKRLLLLLIGLTTLAMACKKESQAEIDRDKILQFIDENNLDAIEDESGLFYVIDVPGSDEKPLLTDSVTVNYRGFLTNGTIFDMRTDEPITFLLNDVITGWKIGIPKFGRDGSGLLLIPSDLGYGDRQVGIIPRNSVLIFEVSLLDF